MPAESLPELFSRVAARRPDALAVTDGTTALTYAALDAEAETLAARLAAAGFARGDLVGLLAGRDTGTVAAVLGILKAGAGYVPLDAAYPAERLRFTAADAGLTTLVGDPDAAAASGLGGLTVLPASGPDAPPRTGPAPAGRAPGRDDTAYVIYTSGSTGEPKGCPISHGNVLALLDGALPLFDVGPGDRWSVFHSFSFDFSVWELWGAFATGAAAVLVPPRTALGGDPLVAHLAEQGVTVFSQIPSVFRAFVLAHEQAGRPPLPLRYVVFGGESVDLDVVARFRAGRPDAPRTVNMYGITEITVHATFAELDGTETGSSPIGRPLPHLRIDLRDPDGAIVPDGEPGEMWLSGPAVAAGYLGRPGLTAERFPVIDGRRYYRSGDLARVGPDGDLEYLGRTDQQIKHRGFRIEPAEIEAVLRDHPGVRDAAVTLVATGAAASFLTACVVADGDSPAETSALRAHLAERLPRHMIPQRYTHVPALPVTPSGKLDRSAVAALAAGPHPERTR